MVIEEIRAAPLQRPSILGRADHPSEPGTDPGFGELPAAVLCVVTAEDRTWGLGMSEAHEQVVETITRVLAPALRGERLDDVGRLYERMARLFPGGLDRHTAAAVAAIDLALWDLVAKRARVPVYEMLGGPAHEAIECYATGFDVDVHRRLGFAAFKLPVPWDGAKPGASIESTTASVAAARELVGPGGRLMLDAWAVDDVDDAVALARATAEYDLAWIEEPIRPDDWDGYGRLLEGAPGLTIAAGERWYGVPPFERMAVAGTVAVFQPDVQWVGGLTPTLRVADIAAAHGLSLALHCGVNDSYGQHACFALPGNVLGELYIAEGTHGSLVDSYRTTPGMSYPVNGRVVPSEAPGFGIELTLADIARATADA
jgi:L-rhamnonate dehydratase